MLWEIDIHAAAGHVDRNAERVRHDARDLGLGDELSVHAVSGYLVEGAIDQAQVERLGRELLADPVVERTHVARVGDASLSRPPSDGQRLIHVLPKPGVMDPVAQSALGAMLDGGWQATAVRTLRKYWIGGADDAQLDRLCAKLLANDAIEQVVRGPLSLEKLDVGTKYVMQRVVVPIRELNDDALVKLSREGQLSLSLAEMRTIQEHYREQHREPTDAELETIAQTWSEHCSHKTLAGRVRYRGPEGERLFENMLKETIFAATQEIRKSLGADDWCVSVFKDNAGVIRFDEQNNVCFKVETHNHPSALEPYGGANTGIGGVIRDPLGTGLGAKPICNTDVFCFAPPDTPADQLPAGVLHPKRVMKGVVSGVRDYGNRMGIPTVNGAIYFDPRYLGNPLVYCGNVGLIPRDKSDKATQPGDLIVAVGGRTGRDGIHGATFSSIELTSDSESLSGGAVQIGNAITEKMVVDVILQARDRGLYNAITDCGAGGFSSAVGEMGEEIGAEVQLDRIPLKYEGLSYTEMWISEAQERMILAVPEAKWAEFHQLCAAESVEATAIGTYVPTGRLVLKYHGETVADLSMEFLHGGRPKVIREATYTPAAVEPLAGTAMWTREYTHDLLNILGSLNVASKEWVIRQYDHEVQGGSVIKPLVGVTNSGPGDAAVVRPVLGSQRGIAISCGMNPRYGDFDTYHMAASAIDEAMRNCVAVGADPARIAILDNFCWGDTNRPETLGSLVRAALACYDLAVVLGTPFISGKDSLNNEFSYTDSNGDRRTIAIPPSLLISAIGQLDDVRQAVTMDLKRAGNRLYIVGVTRDELGGSHLALVREWTGGSVPAVEPARARATFQAVHRAIKAGLVASCHDLSEGGLAVAAAEMAFAGGLGLDIDLNPVPCEGQLDDMAKLFSESNSRFLCEVSPAKQAAFEAELAKTIEGEANIAFACIAEVTREPIFKVEVAEEVLAIDTTIAALEEAWKAPLRW